MQVVAQPRTFLEVLFRTPAKSNVKWFNPLKAHVYSKFTFPKLDWENLAFDLDGVREYTRTLNSKQHVHTVYELSAHAPGKDTVKARLMYMPGADATTYATENTCILLSPEDEMEWNEDIDNVIQKAQASKTWTVELDGVEDGLKEGEHKDIIYDRVNGVSIPYDCQVAMLRKGGFSKEDDYTPSDVKYEKVTYWDFWREMEMEGGVKATEYFIIEMNQRTKYITMWRGTEISPERISAV